MALNAQGMFVSEARRDMREDVHFRTRAIMADGRSVELLVVNVSARGLMARCDDARIGPEQKIVVRLPGAGGVIGEVRWALGGRIGVEFDEMIELARYLQMLAEVLKT
ncbi:PilZ domain-containing protein [Sphingomonas gilva]|uniref:PilZ domain-containing protein n=1 Tax=Sphingomonas gilva TaxID=2305907 RepID=A0A396RM02_9SPHN|nr:PilZ domain-containing protein [Sphingomonas gilva]RHW17279.1 PilZ domain-containing protein [Sphingomonas gilva]